MDGGDLGTTAVIATALVPVVSLVKQAHFPDKVNFIIAIVASVIAAAAGTIVDSHPQTWRDVVPRIGTAFTVGQLVYQLYFKNTTINDKLTNIGSE